MPSTPRSEVPHDEIHAHPAEVRPDGLPCPKLAGVRDGSPRSRESDRLARTHRWQARQLELAEADAQDARPAEGVLRSLLTLLTLDNDVPDHRTISRRTARLGTVASYERRTVTPVHLRIDRSGLAVHVGQWRTPPNARDSRKRHLAVDEHPSDGVAGELTSKRTRDASRVASLVGQIERPIASPTRSDPASGTAAGHSRRDVRRGSGNHPSAAPPPLSSTRTSPSPRVR